jgi:hypothetical protein
MKISKFFKAFSLTTALAMSSGFLTIPMVKAQTSGNFSYSCSNIKLKSQDFSTTAILTADCRRRDGTTNYGTSINLNDYITNHFGQLQWRRNGHFQQSCFGMQLSKMGYNFAHNIGATVMHTAEAWGLA